MKSVGRALKPGEMTSIEKEQERKKNIILHIWRCIAQTSPDTVGDVVKLPKTISSDDWNMFTTWVSNNPRPKQQITTKFKQLIALKEARTALLASDVWRPLLAEGSFSQYLAHDEADRWQLIEKFLLHGWGLAAWRQLAHFLPEKYPLRPIDELRKEITSPNTRKTQASLVCEKAFFQAVDAIISYQPFQEHPERFLEDRRNWENTGWWWCTAYCKQEPKPKERYKTPLRSASPDSRYNEYLCDRLPKTLNISYVARLVLLLDKSLADEGRKRVLADPDVTLRRRRR